MLKLKWAVLLCSAFALTGCSRFFLKKDSYGEVKKAALVQYALNPHLFLGTTQSDEARAQAAEANVKHFIEKAGAGQYAFLTLDEMKANAAYQAMGKDKHDGYWSAPGLRFLLVDRDNDKAELTPEMAKDLAEKLGVDAVVAVSEGWGLAPYAFNTRTKVRSVLTANMYNKAGERIWGDVVSEESDEGMGYIGGIVGTDVPTVVLNATQSFAAGVAAMQNHIAGK